jgi:hypothetical protein
MIDHKYKIGQFVNYKQGSGPGAGVYQIAQLMPPAGDEPQYRIKSETEPHPVRFVRESMSNRLNDEQSAIVVIMQRPHEGDVSGDILAREANYCHMVIPMYFDPLRYPASVDGTATEDPETGEPGGEGIDIGWTDPRAQDDDGEVLSPRQLAANENLLAWPERFPLTGSRSTSTNSVSMLSPGSTSRARCPVRAASSSASIGSRTFRRPRGRTRGSGRTSTSSSCRLIQPSPRRRRTTLSVAPSGVFGPTQRMGIRRSCW